jgi:hypothetical protein
MKSLGGVLLYIELILEFRLDHDFSPSPLINLTSLLHPSSQTFHFDVNFQPTREVGSSP